MERIKSHFYKNGGLKVSILGVFLISLILFLFLVFLTVLFLIYQHHHNNNQVNEMKKYSFLRLNPETNETYDAYSTFHTSIFSQTKEDFISYTDSEGYSVLVSQYGSDRFMCRGTCYCDKSSEVGNKRRAGALPNIVSRGLVILVAALTSSIAINLAKTKFQEECVQTLKDECPSDHIHSMVELCDLVMDQGCDTDEEEEEEEENIKKNDGVKCSGNCIARSWLNDDVGYWGFRDNYARIYEGMEPSVQQQLVTLIQAAHMFNCPKLNLEKEYPPGDLGLAETTRRFEYDMAVFCQEHSKVEVPEAQSQSLCYGLSIQYEGRSGNPGMDETSGNIKLPVCTGTINKRYNPSIQCVSVKKSCSNHQ